MIGSHALSRELCRRQFNVAVRIENERVGAEPCQCHPMAPIAARPHRPFAPEEYPPYVAAVVP